MKPTPPLVSTCLVVPDGVYPAPPVSDTLTDTYVIAMAEYINHILGIATADRHRWAGERACIRAMQKAGQVR